MIHQHGRVAIEQAVQEELAALLEAGRYERRATRCGYRNGHKRCLLAVPTGPLGLGVHVPETLAGDFRKFWRVPEMVPPSWG